MAHDTETVPVTMYDQWRSIRSRIGAHDLVRVGLLPAVTAVAGMGVAFFVVTALLMVDETILLGTFWTRILAVGGMVLLPHFVVGVWTGRRHGISAVPPVAAGIAPVVVLVLALGAFGGPLLTPFRTPVFTLIAVLVWAGVCGCGMVLGATSVERGLTRERSGG